MGGLVARTRDFALSVIDLYDGLPRERVALVKLNGGLMELEETLYWLELLVARNIVAESKAQPIKAEAEQLIAIFVSLIRKWKQ